MVIMQQPSQAWDYTPFGSQALALMLGSLPPQQYKRRASATDG